jgi:hypothetical protein
MTQVDIFERIWLALPEHAWIDHQQLRDRIRGVSLGTITFADESDSMLDQCWIAGLVDQGFVTWRSEYRVEPMSASEASAWQKFQRKMNIWTDTPAQRKVVVFWYQRASEPPLVASRRRAIEQVRDAIKRHNDDEDARIAAALARRAARTAATATTTTEKED